MPGVRDDLREMTLSRLDKFPAPYFGGKADAAPTVWAALGDPAHYVEPFCGSLVALLRRPALANRASYSETVNDADGLLVNAIRSLQLHPQETAEAASWPVMEADLTARHLAIVRWAAERDLEKLMGDPAYCDPRVGGWWLWGSSCWIGGGWASGKGPWVLGDDGRITKRAGEVGVSRRRPHMTGDGQGVNVQTSREPGVASAVATDYADTGGYHPMVMPELRRWFAWLSARLRHVRVLNGDWTRAVTGSVVKTLSVRFGDGMAGVFLDPPYAASATRVQNIYAHDDLEVSHAACEWAIASGTDPKLRVVFAGFEGEHGSAFLDAGWRQVEWFRAGWLKGGHQQHRERLWLSPHCLVGCTDRQMRML